MTIQMELYELKNLCMEMASLGAANYVKQTTRQKTSFHNVKHTDCFKSAG